MLINVLIVAGAWCMVYVCNKYCLTMKFLATLDELKVWTRKSLV